MRRPLPNMTGTNGTPASNPDTPGDPGDPTTSIPGGTVDPDPTLNTPGDSNDGNGDSTYQWTTGPWNGDGPSVCGQQTLVTRQVGCLRLTPSGGFTLPPIGMLDGPKGTDRTMLASSDGTEGTLSSAVYDPSTSKAKIVKAQYSDPNVPVDVEQVDVSFCEAVADQIGSKPINTYSGTKAGCDYSTTDDGYSDWTLPPGGDGTATCSSAAYRTPKYTCQDSDGNTVAMAYCLENISNGSSRNTGLFEPQYGNYAGCTARWYGVGENEYCHKSGDLSPQFADEGPVQTAYYSYECVRSDGTVLTGSDEAACSADDRPMDGVRAVGSCTEQFYAGANVACIADGSQTVTLLTVSSDQQFSTLGSAACVSAGATCCALRQVRNERYALQPYGTYQVIGTTGQPSPGVSFYFDEHGSRAAGDGEDPYFYSYGGGAASWTLGSYSIPDDDRGSGAPPNGNSSGGGGGGIN